MNRIPILLPALAAVLFGACSGKDESSFTLTGLMDATTVRVSAQTPGTIVAVNFDEGTAVSAGQTLAEIETEKLGYQIGQSSAAIEELSRQRASAELQLRAAVIQRDNTQKKYERFAALLASHAATQQSVDDLKAQLDAANEQLKAARASLDAIGSKQRQIESGRKIVERQVKDATITAPIAGTVLVKYTDRGELLGIGSPLCEIADLGAMWTKVYLEQHMLPSVRLGQKVRVRVDGMPDTDFEGTLTWISDKAEFTPKAILTEETRASLVYPAKVAISNPKGIFKIGMPVTVVIARAS